MGSYIHTYVQCIHTYPPPLQIGNTLISEKHPWNPGESQSVSYLQWGLLRNHDVSQSVVSEKHLHISGNPQSVSYRPVSYLQGGG